MKLLLAAVIALLGFLAPATSGEYQYGNAPDVVFKGGLAHRSPYPMSQRQARVWKSDACFRGCTASCKWQMETCVRDVVGDADACRPGLSACDRACQRDCRGPTAGPLLGFLDF